LKLKGCGSILILEGNVRRNALLFLTALLCSCAAPGSLPEGIGPDEPWIEVDLDAQVVRLHDGQRTLGEYGASNGVNTSPQTTTYTGLFTVKEMMKGPIVSVPGVYVTDVVIFDVPHGNGFHSRPMDEQGNILDETLGKPATAGCVRVGDSGAVFDFAGLDMEVWVH
jgi:hypothetical protein